MDEYCKKLWKNGEIFTEKAGEQIVAIVAGYVNDLKSKMAYISLVAVAKEFRRKGLAKMLIQRFAELAREKGFQKIELHTNINNVSARKLYESIGFQEVNLENEKVRYCKMIGERTK